MENHTQQTVHCREQFTIGSVVVERVVAVDCSMFVRAIVSESQLIKKFTESWPLFLQFAFDSSSLNSSATIENTPLIL